MQSPRIFHWTDLLFMLAPCLLCLAALVAVFSYPVGLEARALVGLVLAAVVALSCVEIYRRKAFIDSFEFRYGNVFVKRNGYRVTRDDLEEAIDSVLDRYRKVIPSADGYLHQTPVWVEFVQGLAGPKKAGYVLGGNSVKVGCFRIVSGSYLPSVDVELSSTAFEHELGHVILGRYLGSWSDTQHHKMMEDIEQDEA